MVFLPLHDLFLFLSPSPISIGNLVRIVNGEKMCLKEVGGDIE